MLGFLMVLTIRGKSRLRCFCAALVLLALFGGLIEILQGFVQRTPEWGDFMVNCIGSGAGSGAAFLYKRYRG